MSLYEKQGTFIKFKEIIESGNRARKTRIVEICTDEDGCFVLGQIRWYAPWRKYCFFPAENTVYEQKCMGEIIEVMDELMKFRKIEREREKNRVHVSFVDGTSEEEKKEFINGVGGELITAAIKYIDGEK